MAFEDMTNWSSQGPIHKVNYDEYELERMAKNDSFILNSLMRCGVDIPIAFSLVWGGTMATNEEFPLKLRNMVTDILQEIEKREECYDADEKQLHTIIIDLLYLLYEKEVYLLVERVLETAESDPRYG